MTTRQRGALALSGGGAILAAALAINSAASGHATLGHSLSTSGYVVAASRVGLTMQETPFRADAALDWSNYGLGGNATAWDTSFAARYGMHLRQDYGTPVRGVGCRPAHSISGEDLERIIRHASDPFGIAEHATYSVTRTELEDLRWITKPGQGCSGLAIDHAVFAAGCNTGVFVEGCSPSAPPTPTPTPEPTPPPNAYRWSVRETECPEPDQSLCLALRFYPSALSTGGLSVSVQEVEP